MLQPFSSAHARGWLTTSNPRRILVAITTLILFALLLTTILLNRDHEVVRSTNIPKPNPYAYVFYATEEHYACSALINIKILQSTNGTHAKDYVLVHTPAVSDHMLQQFHALSVKTDPVASIHSKGNGYYADVLTKMYIFNMTRYRRVIFLDSDMLVLKNLDHLFDLPRVDIAAPRAYWLAQPSVTSLLLVVEPSSRVMSRISRYIDHPAVDMFDMDIINREFINESLILPNDYGRLNSEWDHDDKIHRYDYAMDLDEMYERAYVAHFSDLGKPWSFDRDAVRRDRPNAMPQFYGLYDRWNELAWNLTCGSLGRYAGNTTEDVIQIEVKGELWDDIE